MGVYACVYACVFVRVCSYEMVLLECNALNRAANWGVLIVDEGHRLKTKTSKLFQELQAFKPEFIMLLTGVCLCCLLFGAQLHGYDTLVVT